MSRIIKAVTANGEARVYLAETKEVVDEVTVYFSREVVCGDVTISGHDSGNC